MRKKKKRRLILAIAALLILATVIYTIYDNGRFVVVKQDITIDRLPAAFDGYKILQISDLHSKYFGKNQKSLLSAIHSLDYDCLLFTGDMNKDVGSSPEDSQAVLDLLAGLSDEETILWVDGNTGPFAIDTVDGSATGKLAPIGQELADRGVKMLISPVEIERDGQRIWFVPDISETEILMQYTSISEDRFADSAQYNDVVSHGAELQAWYDRLLNNGEVKIHVAHFPIQANLTQAEWEAIGFLDYDLTIAGHYHGGQIRIPFLGALYIPSPTAGIHNGYFPNQKEVKGLNRILDMQQYISAGLGTSNSISFLDFRFFNTPEINLITLHSTQK